MSKVDLRQIIAAFAEKGWNLYEKRNPDLGRDESKMLIGPIDNIMPNVIYGVLPAAEDPLDHEDIKAEFKRANNVGASSAKYHIPGEDRTADVAHVSLRPAERPLFLRLMFNIRKGGIDLPLEEAAQLLRENLSPYERGQDGRS